MSIPYKTRRYFYRYNRINSLKRKKRPPLNGGPHIKQRPTLYKIKEGNITG